ncbi:MAG: tetratricopeptide repeat protein [Candidatus Latescibacteria bacterium]|nr:tetratricopeptide repeat protein [Candidatus Latescibacterota bacterium]
MRSAPSMGTIILLSFGIFLSGGSPVWAKETESIQIRQHVEVDSLQEAMKHYSWAKGHERNGVYEDAIEQYRKAISYDPNNPKMHYALGNVYYKTKCTEEAKTSYLMAVSADSTYINAHYMLAKLYHAEADYDAAISEYEKIVDLKPDRVEVRRSLAELYRYRGREDDALRAYMELSQYVKDDPEIFILTGQLLEKAQKVGQKLERKVLKAERKTLEIERKAERIEEAIEAYQCAWALRPDDMATLETIARLQFQTEDHEEALKSYWFLADQDTTNYAFLVRIVELAEKTECPDDLVRGLKRLFLLRPEDAVPVMKLAQLHFDAGRFDLAKKWIDRGLVLSPENGRLRTLNGDYYLKVGNQRILAFKEFELARADPVWKTYAEQRIASIQYETSEEKRQQEEAEKKAFFDRGKKVE